MPPIQAPPVYPISMLSSHLLALLFSFSYAGSLYLVKSARLRVSGVPDARRQVQPGSRDDPAVIRARLAAVTFATLLNCGIVYALVARYSLSSFMHSFPIALKILGIRFHLGVILSCLQTPLLFLGPLYGSCYLASTFPGQTRFSIQHHVLDTFCTWVGFRNYVWGPLTEEVVFRACVLAVYAMGGATRWKMAVFAPLVFGLAHVHHAWEVYNRLGRTKYAAQQAVLSALFQTAYTTLFGAHASFLFLCTSSLLPPLTAHIFCNIMGVPQMQDEMRRFPAQRRNIIAAYILGVLLFVFTLDPWTKNAESVYWRAPEAFWRNVVQRSA
ncbi:hypothetical protein DFH06DRAFT_1286650 [Mycena polygramma]|nr:hypothetical protein DFH06DRAFT_1286650 [Mycena polygramma]